MMMESTLIVNMDDTESDKHRMYVQIRETLRRDLFEHYVNGICGLIICLLGIISNSLSFSVLIRRTMHLSTYVYLAGLCLSDFMTCLFLIPGYILDAFPVDIIDSELPRTYTYTQLTIISGAISTTARVLSVWLCVAFTIDRWIMICRPFAGPLYCTVKNARYVTLIIYTIGVFYALPLMFESEPHEERGLKEIIYHTEDKFYRQRLSKLGQNSIFRWTYAVINALGIYVIPLTIIVLLNRKLLLSIQSIKRRSEETNAPLPTRQGITVMLLATTVMLLIFRSPSAAVSVMWLIGAKKIVNEKAPFPLRKFHSIANLCAIFNAATTFIMFMIYGTKFREEFTRIYCGCCKKAGRKESKGIINQQVNQLIANNGEQPTDNQRNSSSNRKTRHSSSTTASTSMGSLPSLKRFRNQRRKPRYTLDEQCDGFNPNKNVNQSQEPTIREDECIDLNNGTKSVSNEHCFENLNCCR